jgi:1-acyl-sn-glycerol-3-phosphate acyltransferase
MFLVAIDAGLPIVPVSISGSRHVMLRGRLMTCPGDVMMTIHDPIPTAGAGRRAAREISGRVRDVVATAVESDEVDVEAERYPV